MVKTVQNLLKYNILKAGKNSFTYPGIWLMLNMNNIFISFVLSFALLGVAEANHISGKIEVEGGKSLKNLIVYLETEGLSTPKLEPMVHKVLQKGRRYNPDLIVVSPGDKIQFLNDEDREIDHNIYSLSKFKNFDLGLGERGSVLEVTIDKVGSGNFYCSVHRSMEGRVVSINTRYFAILEKPGNFILPNIPPGNWVVKVIVFHKRYKSIPITISLDDSAHEEIELKVVKK
jgi:plastocyanin